MAEALVVRVSTIVAQDYRDRGVFPELYAVDGLPLVPVDRDRAAELLADAAARVEAARGTQRKALRHFVKQLEGLLETPPARQRARIVAESKAADQRAQLWCAEIQSTQFGDLVARAVWYSTERSRAELLRTGCLRGHRLAPDARIAVLQMIDRVEEQALERRLGSVWRLREVVDIADAAIERAMRP